MTLTQKLAPALLSAQLLAAPALAQKPGTAPSVAPHIATTQNAVSESLFLIMHPDGTTTPLQMPSAKIQHTTTSLEDVPQDSRFCFTAPVRIANNLKFDRKTWSRDERCIGGTVPLMPGTISIAYADEAREDSFVIDVTPSVVDLFRYSDTIDPNMSYYESPYEAAAGPRSVITLDALGGGVGVLAENKTLSPMAGVALEVPCIAPYELTTGAQTLHLCAHSTLMVYTDERKTNTAIEAVQDNLVPQVRAYRAQLLAGYGLTMNTLSNTTMSTSLEAGIHAGHYSRVDNFYTDGENRQANFKGGNELGPVGALRFTVDQALGDSAHCGVDLRGEAAYTNEVVPTGNPHVVFMPIVTLRCGGVLEY